MSKAQQHRQDGDAVTECVGSAISKASAVHVAANAAGLARRPEPTAA
jgi:hypothetical protein